MIKKGILLIPVFFAVAALSCLAQSRREVPEWAHESVFYQVYPSSYKDANGDGMGDLQGIRSKLDYIQSLGVSAIWLNPTFCSAFEDGGYDVTDYYKIDPRFGTNDDLVELVNDAHAHGLKLMLDLVIGHSSDKNPWFIASASGETNQRYSDYYIWAPEGADVSGNSRMVASKHPRKGYYQRNFYEIQPALNFGFANPDPNHPWEQAVDAPGPQAVRREMKNIIAFWMDKGVDGFRCDMAGSLVKNDPGQTATKALWNEVRDWFDTKWPEGVLIAEWGTPALEAGFHVCFNSATMSLTGRNDDNEPDVTPCFFHLDGDGEVKRFAESFPQQLAEERKYGGIAAVCTSNHDGYRLNVKSRNTPEQLKVAMMFFMTLPSAPILYYGEEIGLKTLLYAPVKEGSFDRHNRSSCRTPMQWDASANAGFSTTSDASKLYLPIDVDPDRPTVEKQDKDPNSLLNFTRGLIRLRKDNPAIGYRGDWEFLSPVDEPYPMIYSRSYGGERYIVVLNPRKKSAECTLSSISRLDECIYGDAKAVKASKAKGGVKLKVAGTSCAIYKVD